VSTDHKYTAVAQWKRCNDKLQMNMSLVAAKFDAVLCRDILRKYVMLNTLAENGLLLRLNYL